MILMIIVFIAIGVLGFIGFSRGVRRGLIALAGTLMSAVLIDLWQARWSEWLRSEIDQSLWMVFLLTALIFLAVALLVGYGGSLLLPHDPLRKPQAPTTLMDRGIGMFLGALNAAILTSYLMRYANDIWPEEEAQDLFSQNIVTDILNQWLPWFILAMVLSTMIFVLVKGYHRISQALKQPVSTIPPIKRAPIPPPPAPAPARKAPPAGPTMPSSPPPQPKASPPVDHADLDRIMRDLDAKK
ncbi:CvpA family protein [Candidatus Oscillochloris fontis]|uniref:CvpA family protein n=1 Tax=Candidatus Oscillochloris fontis TaxID=2496868 RepID=UPI00101CAA4A|nr:CvpA family protein [Candidatus Oscillochloris fontis]